MTHQLTVKYLNVPKIMKKNTIPDQLDFSKEIIANLSEEQLQAIEGGAAPVPNSSCYLTSCFKCDIPPETTAAAEITN